MRSLPAVTVQVFHHITYWAKPLKDIDVTMTTDISYPAWVGRPLLPRWDVVDEPLRLPARTMSNTGAPPKLALTITASCLLQ